MATGQTPSLPSEVYAASEVYAVFCDAVSVTCGAPSAEIFGTAGKTQHYGVD
jgi:hypothetical protein